MVSGELQKNIEDYVSELLQKEDNVFLVDAKIKPGNNITVFLDADNGLTIDTCTLINRALYKKIEENALFANGDFSLEVSSAGVDEPLKLHRQYKKNIGRTVEVLFNDDTKKHGKLVEVKDDEITIEERDPKAKKAGYHIKKEDLQTNKQTTILFNQIKHAKVLVTF
jgi:ribosome maturation factor RimP